MLKIQSAPAPASPLPDMPIEPDWITSGTPTARGTILMQSSDKKMSSGVWECTEGEFDWTFTWDEFVNVLEGEVTIAEEGGDTYTLRAGDTAHFPLGLKAHWSVTKTVKKFFVLRTPEPHEL